MHANAHVNMQVHVCIYINMFLFLLLLIKKFLFQLEGGISHLPLLDPSMRAIPLAPSEWRNKLEARKDIDKASNSDLNRDFILLDVRNGTSLLLTCCIWHLSYCQSWQFISKFIEQDLKIGKHQHNWIMYAVPALFISAPQVNPQLTLDLSYQLITLQFIIIIIKADHDQ